jgi:hypothetical protein
MKLLKFLLINLIIAAPISLPVAASPNKIVTNCENLGTVEVKNNTSQTFDTEFGTLYPACWCNSEHYDAKQVFSNNKLAPNQSLKGTFGIITAEFSTNCPANAKKEFQVAFSYAQRSKLAGLFLINNQSEDVHVESRPDFNWGKNQQGDITTLTITPNTSK